MMLLARLWMQFRSIMPFSMTLLLGVMAQLPLSMPVDINVVPAFTLMAVFYWTIYRPDLLPPPAIFLIGLAEDLMSGNLMGLSALLLLATYGLVLNQRRTFLGKPFAVTWWGFAIVAGLALTTEWLVVSLLSWRILGVTQLALQYVTTVTLFPLVVWLFVSTHRHILPRVG